MGITIHYRGTINDLSMIEGMEDRVVDLALALGGKATIWRSYADGDPSRVVRGLMLQMDPGQETMSLLVSPEGHLLNLFEIEAAEKAPFEEVPWCFVKTQFGSLQGHVALVHLLDALKVQYFSNLEVDDESDYWQHRDPAELARRLKELGDAISALGEGLSKHGLSDEAAEDPEIVATRIERVAALVAQRMCAGRDAAAADHEASEDDDENPWAEIPLEDEVAKMDVMHRKNQLRSERMTRRIAEATAQGMTTEEAFELAMREEGLPLPKQTRGFDAAADPSDNDDEVVDLGWEDDEAAEPWRESLPSTSFEDTEGEEQEKHPATETAEALLGELMSLDPDSLGSFGAVATQGLFDVLGGLVQATGDAWEENHERAHAIVQLKRALKGHAFARGAFFGLRASGAIDEATSRRAHAKLESMLESIHALLDEAWMA